MIDMIPGLLTGLIAGAIVGWVIGHHWASQGKSAIAEQPTEPISPEDPGDDQTRIENVTRKIRSLTLSVAADVSAHQSKVADITTGLEVSAAHSQTESIVATVAELVAANKTMQEKLAASQQQIREQSKQLQTTQQLAYTDALTGLANRRHFDAELAKVKNTLGPDRGSLALIDIDHFKSVNDVYGHPTGDIVLGRVAELLDANLGDFALCSRFGGEEFAVFFSSSNWELLAKSLDQVRHQLSSLRLIPEAPERQITFSCGIAPHAGEESNEAWLGRVDAALYAAKDDGRNNVQFDLSDGPQRFSERPEVSKDSKTESDRSISSGPASKGTTDSATPHQDCSPPQEVKCSLATSGLPTQNRACLVSQLRTMAANIDLDHVSVAAVAIRLPELPFAKADLEDLLHETRSLLRAVDRVGYDDDRTMLVLMVTSNMRKSEERANQLVDHINDELRKLFSEAGTQGTANCGISVLGQDTSAEDVIAAAVDQAMDKVSVGV